jgi:hypothetical protein
MRFAGPLFALLLASGVHAAPYVDPTAIEADAPEMLQPSAIHSFCGPHAFAISVDPVQLRRGQGDGEALTYPLDEHAGTKTIECKQNDGRIVATLRITPPGGNGFCGAVHYVHVKLQIDDQLLLATKFAEYCAPWGLTSLSLIEYSEAFPPSTLRMCGYWRASVPVADSQLKVDKRSFECADFSTPELLEKKLVLTDGPHEIHALKQ